MCERAARALCIRGRRRWAGRPLWWALQCNCATRGPPSSAAAQLACPDVALATARPPPHKHAALPVMARSLSSAANINASTSKTHCKCSHRSARHRRDEQPDPTSGDARTLRAMRVEKGSTAAAEVPSRILAHVEQRLKSPRRQGHPMHALGAVHVPDGLCAQLRGRRHGGGRTWRPPRHIPGGWGRHPSRR